MSREQLTEDIRRLMGIAPRPLGPWSARPEETWEESAPAELAEGTFKLSWDDATKLMLQGLNKLRTTGPKWLKDLTGGAWKAGKVKQLKGKGAAKKLTARLRLFVGPSETKATQTVVVTLRQTEAPGSYDYFTGDYVSDLIEIAGWFKLLEGKKDIVEAGVGIASKQDVQNLTDSVLPAAKDYIKKHFGHVGPKEPPELAEDALKAAEKELVPWLKKTTGHTDWASSWWGTEELRLHVGSVFKGAPIAYRIRLYYDKFSGKYKGEVTLREDGVDAAEDELKGLNDSTLLSKVVDTVKAYENALAAAKDELDEDPTKVAEDALAKLEKDALPWLKKVTGEDKGWDVTPPGNLELNPWVHFTLKPPGESTLLTVSVAVSPLNDNEGFQVQGDVMGVNGQPFGHLDPIAASAEDLDDLVKVALEPMEAAIKEVIKVKGDKVLTLIKDVRNDYKDMRRGIVKARKALEFISGKLELEDYTGVEAKCKELEGQLSNVLNSSKQLRSKLPY